MHIEQHGGTVIERRPFMTRDGLTGRERERHDRVDEIARAAMTDFESRQQQVIDRAIGEHFRRWTADEDSPEREKFSAFVAKASREETERVVALALEKFAAQEHKNATGGDLDWKKGAYTDPNGNTGSIEKASLIIPDDPAFWRNVAADGVRRRMNPFQRAITAQGTAVTGAPVDGMDIFVSHSAANEFAGLTPVRPVTGDSFKVPRGGAITFAAEDTINPSGRTESGSLDSDTIAMKSYIAQTSISLAQDATISGIRAEFAEEAMRQAGSLAGSLIYAAIKTSVNSTDTDSFSEVASGVAAGPPTKANVYGKMLDMYEGIEAAYRSGAIWILARKLERRLLEAESTSDFVIDPVSGLRTLLGYPAIAGDHLVAAAADDCMAVFGRPQQATVLGWGSPMIMSAIMLEYAPGKVTFFSHVRYAAAVRDPKALIGMRAKA